MPCLRAGTALRIMGEMRAMCAKKTHQRETKANWTIVKVIGLGYAFSMDFEDVLVNAELKYQIKQRV